MSEKKTSSQKHDMTFRLMGNMLSGFGVLRSPEVTDSGVQRNRKLSLNFGSAIITNKRVATNAYRDFQDAEAELLDEFVTIGKDGAYLTQNTLGPDGEKSEQYVFIDGVNGRSAFDKRRRELLNQTRSLELVQVSKEELRKAGGIEIDVLEAISFMVSGMDNPTDEVADEDKRQAEKEKAKAKAKAKPKAEASA